MTVLTPSSITPTYVGNGVTTVFAYSFRIFTAADMVVTQTDLLGVQTILTLNTHYTLSGVGSLNGGNIILNTALPSGYTLVGRCILALTQTADVRNQGAFFPEVHEDVFDKLLKIDQQQQEQIERALAIVPVSAVQAMLDQTAAIYDQFDDRYLGAKSADPTLDNDGNALATGAIYFNTSTNKLKVYTGSVWIEGVGTAQTVSTQLFTASGTYTKPAGLIVARVIAIGGGGGGGGTANSASAAGIGAGGGGGGGCAEKWILAASIGATETVTIGAAGLGGIGYSDGGNGGNTTFGAHCTANGGQGGHAQNANGSQFGGSGGGATNGNLNVAGQGGGAGYGSFSQPAAFGGAGGGSALGGGSNGQASSGGGVANGNTGGQFGGGGGGGASSDAAGAANGGNGSAGVIFVVEYKVA